MSEINSFIVGSPDFLEAGEMLGAPSLERFDAEKIKTGREERKIPIDAQERFNLLLKRQGWERVTEIAPGATYPSLDTWVAFRINYGRGTNTYPCFIKDAKEDISFLKVSLTNNPQHTALENEARMLENCQGLAVTTPKLLRYNSTSGETLPYLQTTAVAFDEGRVGNADEWTTKHVEHAVQQIKALEGSNLNKLPDFPNLKRNVEVKALMLSLMERAGINLPPELAARIRNLGQGEEIKDVLVHGDLTLKNIILNAKGETTLVDWELGGRGFLGQDAGKLLSSLSGNNVACQTLLREYLTTESGSIDQERLQGLVVGVVAENLIHFVWRAENVIASGKEGQFPKVEEEMMQQLKRIEEALAILNSFLNQS